ncbi:MAG: BTAD domain-containing putative transcriptional regulator [Vicinamibacterales bacterium]|jgi:TolB-like protein|nr:BTAD domain-containing putative transcriptional regulator [Vicinamibacterales bacterium]
MTRTVRLALLGPFEARWSDGETLALSGKKIQGLVAYLAIESDRAHAREELATLLWSEAGEERARHNLRQALSKIRRGCESLIVSEDDTLRLDREHCEVDVHEFWRQLDTEEPDELRRGLDLYRHDLLEGLVVREEAFDDWLRDARTRLRDLACGGFERLADALTALDRLDEAIAVLRRRLVFDPACEQAHRGLMELLARTGRRSDALRQYQTCVDALARELGVEPGVETQATYARIRQAESDPSPSSERREPDGPRSEGPTDAETPSVAVLPFENLTDDEDRYFTDGITEDIITALSRFGGLLVIARESSFAFRDRDRRADEIGRELGFQFIVRGTVRRAGSRVRLGVQLLGAASAKHVWAQRFDRDLEDVFALQDEITETVVSTLAGQVEAARLARARRTQTEQLDAYDFVLRGKDHHHRLTPDDCDTAIEMFERAIERDGDYALAHAWLGCGLGQAMQFRPDESEALLERAERAAERGRQLDDNESECHRILAQVAIIRHDLIRARSHQERAVLLNPNDDRIVCAMGTLLVLEGRAGEAEAWIRKAMRLNPYHHEAFWFHLGRALFHAERHAEAWTALGKITRPRLREAAYRVAIAARLGHPHEIQRAVDALRVCDPGFDAERWASAQPFQRLDDRAALCDALQSAGV